MQRLQIWIFSFLILVSFLIQYKITHSQTIVNDFCQDYVALQNFWHNRPIYELFPVKICWQNLNVVDNQYPAHPPSALLFFVPLSYLTLSQATFIWDISNITFYFFTLIILLLYIHKFNLKTLAYIFLLSSIWLGLLISLSSRNLTLLITLLISLSLITFTKRPVLSGFFLGLAALLKLWPILFLLYPKNNKYMTSGIFTIIIGATTTLKIFGYQNNLDYLQKVVPFEHVFITSINNISLTSILAKTHYNLFFSNAYFLILIYVSLLFLKNYKNMSYDMFLTTSLILIFVFMPLTWDNSSLMLLVPLFVLIKNIQIYRQANLAFFALGFIPLLGPELSERANHIIFSCIFSVLPLFALVNFLSYNKTHEPTS